MPRVGQIAGCQWTGNETKLLQGDPVGRKTTLKKPLTADATLGADGHCNVGGVGPVGEGGKRLSDLPKNSKESMLDLTGRELIVKPSREVVDALFPVLQCLRVWAARDMKMIFMCSTQRILRMSLMAPDLEELANPTHANSVLGSPPLKFGREAAHRPSVCNFRSVSIATV